MRKLFVKITAACLLAAIALYAGALQARQPIAAAPASVTQPLQQQVRHWVDELAEQPHFTEWKRASLHISPIGPGTHSWLVLVKHNNDTIGYLVVNAIEQGGYQLGEYGTGNHPIFDQQTLSRSIKQLELMQPAEQIEALYVHPLLAAWKVTVKQEIFYTDAASGELLPVQPADWLAQASVSLNHPDKEQAPATANLLKHVTLSSFDRFAKLPWLTKEPLHVNTSSYSSLFKSLNNKEQLRYAAELFDGQMLYVWSVVGYNKWDNDHLYLALEEGLDGTERRYIPLQLLLELGHFYR
ncbi:hypothetical protein [Paenibacillus sp. sgz302251]|uniref:hypothetical protein n=1 Tax=Paenibacillus sp. sgz302251 TaxID=3414493 RepID=UPI003C79ACE9